VTDSPENKRIFRILSIDGGGIRGVYPAYILKRMEEEWNVDWRNRFQLIAGTSTGSIIAAGLACGRPASEIVTLYDQHAEIIFQRRQFHRLGLFGSRYNNTGLKKALTSTFGDIRLGDLTTPLNIPATNIGNGCVHVFKSAYDAGFVRDRTVLVRDAVLASCSAPTYFDPCQVQEYALADGGLWANNPALAAAIDAKRRMNKSLEQLRILTLGTGTGKQFYPQKKTFGSHVMGWGFATRWKRQRFIGMLLNLQAETATNMLGLMLDRSQILRLNFESNTPLPLDDIRDIPDLKAKAALDFTYNADRIKAFLIEGQEET